MKIVLTPQESEKFFYNALCNGLSVLPGYGSELVYNRDHYKQAKESLLKKGTLDTICFEDVLMELLRMGKPLIWDDKEGEGDCTRKIQIGDIYDRVQNTPYRHLIDMEEGQDDINTADAILQTVFFNDIIFG